MGESARETLSAEHLDLLNETLGIGLGRAAAVFNRVTRSHVSISAPSVRVGTRAELPKLLARLAGTDLAIVNLRFQGDISGSANLIFLEDAAAKLVALVVGEEVGTGQLDSMRAGALSEVGNIVLNGIMDAISNVLDGRLTYSVPEFLEDSVDHMFNREDSRTEDVVLVADGRLEVEGIQVIGDIALVFERGSFETLTSRLATALTVA